MKNLIVFELRKILSKRLSIIALIGTILISFLISFSTYQRKYAFDGVNLEGKGKMAVEIEKRISSKYEGILTDEKVQEMLKDFSIIHNLNGLNATYIYQNSIQSSLFTKFVDKDGNWNGLKVSDVFGDEEIKIGYVDGWLSTSKNMMKVFVLLAISIIIMLSPIFSSEYEGVDNIILTTKYGKTKCSAAKIIVGVISSIIVTSIVVCFNIVLAMAFYGTEGLNSSILFSPIEYMEGFIPFNITCKTLIKYQIILAFTCALSITGITLFLSSISKNQIISLVSSVTFFIFPILLPITKANPMFKIIGLLPFYHVQSTALLSVEQLSNGLLYAIWAIPSALLFLALGSIISYKVFANHEVL